MKPAVFRPAACRARCIIGRRTSAWMPDRKMVPLVEVYLSSRLTGRELGAGVPSGRGGIVSVWYQIALF
jgi:hypothetical protein